jgi:activating signal cointegrator complex subunit 1
MDKANDETKEQLLRLVPTYESLASSSKVHLIQSLVSRLLLKHIFDAYFIGLPTEHANELSKAEKYLSTFGKFFDA